MSLKSSILIFGGLLLMGVGVRSVGFLKPRDVHAQSIANIEWPQFQHDAQHTGRTTAFVKPDFTVRWGWIDKDHKIGQYNSPEGGSIVSGFSGITLKTTVSSMVQPIAVGGRVYFGALDGVVYCIDLLTGNNVWSYQTGGKILGTAAEANNIVVVGSLDGSTYAFDVGMGTKKWQISTGGVSAAITIVNGVAYVPTRTGYVYALDIQNGSVKWTYAVRDPGNGMFSKAPVVSPVAISEDAGTVVFGAENMYVYALNTNNGSEKWTPKKVIGQSFLFTWPVIKGNKVIFRTMSSLPGAEDNSTFVETYLDGLSADPTWSEEKAAISRWLSANLFQKTMYVLDINSGIESYQVAMGRVSGENFPPFPPVLTNNDKILTYWRSKVSTFFNGTAFGSKYCSDISYMDESTGDRQKINLPIAGNVRTSCAEIDNGYALTVGGDYLYLNNSFRGTKVVNLITGENRGLSATFAVRDCANWRGGTSNGGWGYQIIYYGNEGEPDSCVINPSMRPSSLYQLGSDGFAGIVPVVYNGVSLLLINEKAAGAMVAIQSTNP